MKAKAKEEDEGPGPLLYPPYIEKRYPERVLAYFDLDRHTLVLETGQEIVCSCWRDFHTAIFAENLLTFVETLTTFPYLSDIIELCNPRSQRGTAIFCTPVGEFINARIRSRQYTRWLITAFSWGLPAISLAVLHTLRDLYAHVGLGTQGTPGALGQAAMRRSWAEQYGNTWAKHRHLRPPGSCVAMLRSESTGARSELVEGLSAGYHPVVIELDRKNAYADAFRVQPTGNTIRFTRGMTRGLVKFFAHCTVTISQQLPLGCFPQRVTNEWGEKEVVLPTLPGTYDVALWNDEIELCKEEGCTVEVHDGYGWRRTTSDPDAWVRTMEQLRDTAPSEEVATYIKLATVAAIGRHGISEESYRIGPEEEGSIMDVAYQGRAYEWYVHQVWDDHPTGQQHWFSHTLMQCRLALFKEAKKWHEKEMLYGTNVDAVYVAPEADVENYVDKSAPALSGTWRKSVLHGEPGRDTFPARRHLDTKEKVRKPGVPRVQKIGHSP